MTRLTKRNRRTLSAAARVLVPPGGALPWGADDLGLTERIVETASAWPPRVRLQVRVLLTAVEWLPWVTGHRRRFSRLSPEDQEAVLEANYHHRSALRRLVIGFVKQLCYTFYLSSPEVEEAVGYRYTCLRPREGVEAAPEEQIHH